MTHQNETWIGIQSVTHSQLSDKHVTSPLTFETLYLHYTQSHLMWEPFLFQQSVLQVFLLTQIKTLFLYLLVCV